MKTGTLTVTGLGPGDASLLAPAAVTALEKAACIVGYSTYLDLVDPELLAEKKVVSTGMMKETDRCLAAVDAAQQGMDTVIVSSGDAGIYGMSGLVLEILETRGLLDAISFSVIPGIPALAAAAALLGAPLMHDFAVVSLSDLLTPWELIEKRLKAAAEADFTIVLYNPRSKRRNWQLGRALEIVRTVRSDKTPVGLVNSAYRPEQQVSVHELGVFSPELADMLSIVLVGNASTRMVEPSKSNEALMLTPRGYANKYNLEK